jgi:quinol monooxygenase YgiN
VSLVIAGTVRVPSENLDGLRPHMKAMVEASQAEDGCAAYAYSQDVLEPGLIHVFEVWCDQAALDAHFKSAHMARWREAWPSFGVSERRLIAYEIADQRPL